MSFIRSGKRFRMGALSMLAMLCCSLAANDLWAAGIPAVNLTSQNYPDLFKYKLLGEDYVAFQGSAEIQEQTGYFGTNGDLSNQNSKVVIPGIVLVRGKLTFAADIDFGTSSASGDYVRIGDTISEQSGKYLTTYNSMCADVPNLTYLKRPTSAYFSKLSSCDVSKVPAFPATIAVVPEVAAWTTNYSNISTSNEAGKENHTLSIGGGTVNGKFRDYFVDNISIGSVGGKLFIEQKQGDLTRIFVNKLSLSNKADILVVRPGSSDPIDNSAYQGSVLIYAREISLAAGDSSNPSIIQASILSPDTITIPQRITVIGQVMGQALMVNDGFSGADFKYVPFDPPVVNINPTAAAGANFIEDGAKDSQTVVIAVSAPAVVDVKLAYRFVVSSFKDSANAEPADFKGTVFSAAYDTLVIKETKKEPVSPAKLLINDESVEEMGIEYFYLELCAVEGAVLESGHDCDKFPLTIAPSDTNHAPVIADQKLSITENLAPKLIHTFTATDVDAYTDKPDLTYKIIEMVTDTTNMRFPFSLSSAGLFSSTVVLDYEDTTLLHSYIFKVEVNDNSLVPNTYLKDTATVTLTLADANDAPTAMTLSPNSVVENAKAKTFVGTLSTTDQDALDLGGRTETETFVYSLPQAADQSVFQISNDSLYTKASLDFETKASYSIQIQVADSKNATYAKTFSVVVRDTNDAPTALTLSKDSVSENQAIGTLVGTLGAVDQDAIDVPNRTENESFTYSLVSGTGDTDNASFQITGAQLQTKAKFDYETKKSYSIRVRVTDKGGLTKESVFVIKVHDENEAPYFDKDTLRVNVAENTSAVATIKATDLWNAPLSYSLSTGADASLFSVNPTSGSLVFSSAPNFENPLDANKDNAYELRVRAFNGVFSAEQVVIVTVTDVQEIGTLPATATKSLAENTTAVLQVSVTDVDAKQGKVYTVSGGADASLFTIDENGALSFVSAPDFEKPSDQGKDNIYVVVVSVSDAVEPEFSALLQTVSVTVTNVDENPSAKAHEYTTPEEVSLTVAAPGILSDATDPEGAVLKDSLVLPVSHGILNLSSDGSFSYTPEKDYFGRDTFTYVVIDPAGHLSELRTVAIAVTPINDAPEFAPAVFSIDENAPAGTVVGQVKGTDVDGDRLTYALVKGSGFVVAPNGQITVDTGTVLDYESAVKSFLIRVSASDDSGLSAQADVEIVLKNVVETANVMVVSAEAGDSLWSYPDTVWVNKNTVDVSWAVEGSLRKDTDSVKTNAFTQLVKTASVPEKDLPSSDTLVVVMNDKAPVIDILLPPKRPNPIPGTTAVEPSDTTDPVIYINDKERDIAVSIQTKDKQMQDALVLDTIRPVLKEGLNDVTYTYTDIYGNTATKTVQVYLDLTAPVVVIQSPENLYKTSNVLQYVVWTVDGDTMDVLNLQSLQDGANTIVRAYRDKAGNEGSDTVIVFFEMGKGIELSMEKDLVTLDPETIEKYYAANPPKEDELYSVSLLNLETGKEEKVSYGKGAATHAGDSSEPYAGLSGTHLGPTLVVRIRLPQMGGTDATGAARGGQISDLVENGMVALTSGTGSERTMVPVSDYVSGHCLADAFDKGLSLEEMLASPQYKSTVSLKVHVFDVTGQFVDNMSVTQEIESASYLDDAGVLTLFFELKPSREHGLEDITGRQYGTGAYLMNASVKAVSVRRCDTPDGAKGEKIKSSDQVLEKFGYMRASW